MCKGGKGFHLYLDIIYPSGPHGHTLCHPEFLAREQLPASIDGQVFGDILEYCERRHSGVVVRLTVRGGFDAPG